MAVHGMSAYVTTEYGGMHVLALDPGVTTVAMDILPGSCTNPLNVSALGGNGNGKGNGHAGGVVKAAILGASDLDVRDVDATSVNLEGATPVRWQLGDVAALAPDGDSECPCPPEGPDGYADLVLTFERADIADAVRPASRGGRLALTLQGFMKDGRAIEASDCVTIVGGGGPVLAGAAPEPTALRAARPNPFNPTTQIAYHLAREGRVELTVYDAAGRRVARLADGVQAAGDHDVMWRAEGFASGVYFARLVVAGGVTQTIKLVLMK
jgi:hypothetical protein